MRVLAPLAPIVALVATSLSTAPRVQADEPVRGSARGAPEGNVRRDPAAAEALFDQARKLLAAGNVRAACPKFAESYRLDPALGSLLNLATCHQLEGKTASAWGEFRDAEQQARRASDTKRQKFAADHAAALEGGLPKLVVTVVDAATGLVVARDGVALGEGSFNTPLPIDPGEHVISAEAPGHKPWQATIEAEAGQRASVIVPALEVAEASGPDGDPRPGGPSGDAPSKDGGASGRTVGIAVAAAGLASLAVGGVFAGLFFDQAATTEDCKGPNCSEKDHDAARDKRDTYGTVCAVTLAVGSAGLIVGGVVFLMSGNAAAPPPPPSSASRWTLIPVAGPDGARLSARVSF